MSDRVIGCTVYIDGQPISDGCSALSPDAPAVLSGLRVIWGRSSSVDQATASSCTFAVNDPIAGADRLVPSLTIGRRVDVEVDTVIFPDPTVSTIPVLLPGPVQNVNSVTGGGTTSNTILAGPEPRAAGIVYPPRAYSQNPLAWDSVPRTLPGQAWELRASLTFPAMWAGWRNYAARVQPVTFVSPAGPGTLLADNATLSPAATSATLRFTPPAGVWLGLQVTIYPAGPRWADLDSSTWLGLPNPGPSWDDLARFVLSGVQMLAPAEGAADSGLVFSGRITDVSVEWDGGESTTVQVIAQDWLAELANRFVGDQPWAMEPINTRAQRIVQQSGQPVTLAVDPRLGALQVTWRDVDRQPAANLLQGLATSGGGILWTATHLVSGQTMWIEDIADRPAALTLQKNGLVHVVPSKAAVANGLPISACDIEADPVRFTLDMSDTVSMVALGWYEQTLNTEGQQQPTQRTVEVSDAVIMGTIGARRLSVSTQLAVATDAQAQAALWLARSSALAWRIEGLAWDTGLQPGLSPDAIDTVMTLLDGVRRIGLPITLTDLPSWSLPVAGGMDSVALYVEGGEYTYNAGAWRLELNTSSATGSAVGNLPWNNLPAPVVPAATRTNRLQNPRAIDVGYANWPATRGTGATYSWLTGFGTPPVPGVSTARRKTYTVATGANDGGFWIENGPSGGKFPVVAGRQYAISVYMRHTASAARNGLLQAGFSDAAGALIVNWLASPTVSIPPGTAWVRVSGVFTAPAAAVGLLIAADISGAFAVGNTHDATAAMIEEIAAVGTYFDGSTADAPPIDYAWTGAANASTSTRTDTTAPVTGWRWIDFDPAVEWIDLFGVTYPDV